MFGVEGRKLDGIVDGGAEVAVSLRVSEDEGLDMGMLGRSVR